MPEEGGVGALPETMGKTTSCDVFDRLIYIQTQTRTEGAKLTQSALNFLFSNSVSMLSFSSS